MAEVKVQIICPDLEMTEGLEEGEGIQDEANTLRRSQRLRDKSEGSSGFEYDDAIPGPSSRFYEQVKVEVDEIEDNEWEVKPKKERMQKKDNQAYFCLQCDKRFGTKWTLLLHEKIHSGDQLPFSCEHEDCDKTFYYRKDLIRHLVTHTGERMHLCTICNRNFNRKDNLVRHLRLKHNDVCESLIANLKRGNPKKPFGKHNEQKKPKSKKTELIKPCQSSQGRVNVELAESSTVRIKVENPIPNQQESNIKIEPSLEALVKQQEPNIKIEPIEAPEADIPLELRTEEEVHDVLNNTSGTLSPSGITATVAIKMEIEQSAAPNPIKRQKIAHPKKKIRSKILRCTIL